MALPINSRLSALERYANAIAPPEHPRFAEIRRRIEHLLDTDPDVAKAADELLEALKDCPATGTFMERIFDNHRAWEAVKRYDDLLEERGAY